MYKPTSHKDIVTFDIIIKIESGLPLDHSENDMIKIKKEIIETMSKFGNIKKELITITKIDSFVGSKREKLFCDSEYDRNDNGNYGKGDI